jgi:DNA-binding LacI/PurR family transcriptional regulator
MPTIKDVAREAGVSIATVSYVINNKDSNISEDTRRLVLEAIERIGYTPNATARNLKSRHTRLIGYAWHKVPPGQVNSVLDYFMYYLAQAAEEFGYHILTFTHPTDDPCRVYDELIRTQRVDAFVLADTFLDDPRIPFLLDRGFPFVSFGRSNLEWEFPWVDTDGQHGVREAVGYLLELGHRRIAMIAWPEDSIAGGNRLAGYLEALERASLEARPEYIWRGKHSEQTGREALAYWCALPPDQQPTAVIAVSDLAAIGVLNEAEHLGKVVGQTLSVIGFDDVPLGQYLRPALTTIRQPIPDIGRIIIEMLRQLLSQKTLPDDHILVPPRLIIRDSCGPPR